MLLRHCLDDHDSGRWVRLTDEAQIMLRELDFAWPGNVRHLEQLAARLATEQPEDAAGPEQVLNLLGDLNAENGTAILMVTHSPEAAGVGTHRIHIEAGSVVEAAAQPA